MYSKIKNDFKKSLFYKNYKNINIVFSTYKKIKIEHNHSKMKYKNKTISFIKKLLESNMYQCIIEKYIKYLTNKYEYNDIVKNYQNTYNVKKIIDALCIQNYKYLEILNQKIKNENYLHYLEKNYENFIDDEYNSLILGENTLLDTIDVLNHKLNKIDKKLNKFDINIQLYYNILLKRTKIGHSIKKYVHFFKNENYIFISVINTGSLKNIKILIQKGADMYFDNNKALFISCENGNLDIVKFLVKKGANIHDIRNDYIDFSTKDEHREFYNMFSMNNIFNFNSYNYNPLGLSYKNGHIEVYNFLIEKGAKNIH
jgi:ankyrin repeat protein